MDRHLRRLAILSFFAVVAFLCWFKVISVDFGWHLKAGEHIVSTRSIPRHDIFSYVAEGNPWVDSHWLFQVVLYGWYAAGGLTSAG